LLALAREGLQDRPLRPRLVVGPERPRDPVDPGRLSGEAGIVREGLEDLFLLARPLGAFQELDHPTGGGAGLFDDPTGLFGVGNDRLDDRLRVVAPELLERPARARFVHLERACPRREDRLQGPTFHGGRLERVQERFWVVPVADPSREERRAAAPGHARGELRGEGVEEPDVRKLAELVVAFQPARERREGGVDALGSPLTTNVQLRRHGEVRRRVGSRGPIGDAREEVSVALRAPPADSERGPGARPADLEERTRLAGLQMRAFEAVMARILDESVRKVGDLVGPELRRRDRGEAGAEEALAGRVEVEALAGPFEVPEEKPLRVVRLLDRDLGLPVRSGERGVGDLSAGKREGDHGEGLWVEVVVEEARVRPRERVPPARELLEAPVVIPSLADLLELGAPTVEALSGALGA